MDRYKVNPSYKKRHVIPRYVWLTSGVGNYTNQKSAEFIAKKAAGIDELYYDDVSRIEKSPFILCTKDEFLAHAANNKIYKYGTQIFSTGASAISACVSGISMPDWGYVSYGAYRGSSVDRIKRSILKEMCYEYEADRQGILPNPTQLVEHVQCADDREYCVLVAAMIIE